MNDPQDIEFLNLNLKSHDVSKINVTLSKYSLNPSCRSTHRFLDLFKGEKHAAIPTR